MKSKLLSIDNIFEEVRDRVVWIKFKHLNMPEDKPKLNQYLKRLILEYGLKEPIYIQSTLKVSDGYNRLMCLKDIITDIDDVKIPCIMKSYATTTDIKKRQKELYKMDIDKFRGGRAIPDLQVKSFWENIDADGLSDVLTNNTNNAEIFVDTFHEWIQSSKLNNIKGLLNYKTFTAGTSQAFDTFWMRHHDKRFRCFQGEFFYHKANWKKFHKWEYIDNRDIAWGDAVVISYPFSDSCNQHSEMKHLLDRCEKSKVPVLIDCAYYVIAKDLDFDFSNYSCVEDIVFSLSKGFYQANKLRAGIRYSRYFRDDNIDMYNEWEQLNHL